MKKTLLVTTLVLLGALGFTINVQAATCNDVIWSASAQEQFPNVVANCLEVVEKEGVTAVRARARVESQGPNLTIIRWQRPDGSWSPTQRVFPDSSTAALISGEEVKILELKPNQEVNVYIPAAGNWSLPAAAPVAAAAPPPPPPPPPAEPEPEPAPVALPTTATQVSLFALLGGLFVLLGGIVGVARMRL